MRDKNFSEKQELATKPIFQDSGLFKGDLKKKRLAKTTRFYTHTQNSNRALYFINLFQYQWIKLLYKKVSSISKENPFICCLQEIHLNSQDKYSFRVKGWEKIIQTSGRKKSGTVLCTSDHIVFNMKRVIRDSDGQY